MEIKTINDVAEQTRAGSQNNLLTNAVYNFPRIHADFLKARPDFANIAMPPGTPAMIIGAGPSLNDQMIASMRGWRGSVYCTPQTWPILVSHGVIPNFVTAVDTSIDDVIPLRGEGNGFTSLITHPSIHPEMIGGIRNMEPGKIELYEPAWKGPVLYTIVNFDDECDTLFRAIYPFITFTVGAQGCVSNIQLIMASGIKNVPIVLVGVDMAYAGDGTTHSQIWRKVGLWRWEGVENPKTGKPNEIPLVMQFYRALLAVIWKGTRAQLYRVGDGGVPIIPQISMEDAKAKNFPKQKEQFIINRMIDEYTIPMGVYGSLDKGNVVMVEFAERITGPKTYDPMTGKQIGGPKNAREEEAATHWKHLPDGKWERERVNI